LRVRRLNFTNSFEAFLYLKTFGYPVKLFLDSANPNTKTGRYSIICVGVEDEIVLKDDKTVLSKLYKFFSSKCKFIVPELPFGIYGYISYDVNRFIENVPTPPINDLSMPDIHFILPYQTLIFDNLKRECYQVSFGEFIEIPESFSLPSLSFQSTFYRTNMEKDYFVWAVKKIKDYIASGDSFQVNFSQRLDVLFEGSHLELYRRLRKINPSPFSFYFELGNFTAVSCSPERLVRVKNRIVETRPIAGTRRRGKSKQEDVKLEKELFLSEKERAEHIMLVDLERNDLGRICEYGSVEVNELMVPERYSHVIHIVSNVRGILRREVSPVDVLRALFPGGTITGAPKVRTMEIISELEPTRRVLYTGSVGYMAFNGDMDFNIVIRTLLFKENLGTLQVGAGIVWDSDPSMEYEETLHKGRALLESLGIRL